ncbi:DUF1127 domain-containing protein [Roseibium sp. RKSG952]|uniref:DUF1127 domain-containing protein n=1 Tax=Roseibium sp. RKSG952 TaxID=2529384 RepID=UPI001AD8C9C1|nr:DUF1127 domain-containing protein [Roseibium sp. RKSG952]
MFKSVRECIARKNSLRRTRRELSALTDRELNDIGLTRSDISPTALFTERLSTREVLKR